MDTAQNFVPNDSATITVTNEAGALAGSVVFELFVNDTDCSEPAAYTSDPIDITTGTGTDFSKTVVSGNTQAYDTDGDTFSWVVTYTSTNTGHESVSSPCTNETSSHHYRQRGDPTSGWSRVGQWSPHSYGEAPAEPGPLCLHQPRPRD